MTHPLVKHGCLVSSKAILFFLFVYRRMCFLMLGRSVGFEKRKTEKKNHKKSRYPRTTLKVNIHIFGLTNVQYTVKNVHVFALVFLCAVTICSCFRLKELFQVKNGVTTSLPFFLKCQKFGSVGRR